MRNASSLIPVYGPPLATARCTRSHTSSKRKEFNQFQTQDPQDYNSPKTKKFISNSGVQRLKYGLPLAITTVDPTCHKVQRGSISLIMSRRVRVPQKSRGFLQTAAFSGYSPRETARCTRPVISSKRKELHKLLPNSTEFKEEP